MALRLGHQRWARSALGAAPRRAPARLLRQAASPVDVAAVSSTVAAAVDPTSRVKLELLQAVAGLDRGKLCTDADMLEIDRLVRKLETAGGVANPLSGTPAPIEGTWELVFSSKEVFRASPFFAAFQNGLVQDKQVAEAIFQFTDALPGAYIGRAIQRIDLTAASLASEVDMEVFPGFKGTVVTTSRCFVESPAAPATLRLVVDNTRVANSIFPLVDSIAVPVEQLVEQVRGAGATAVMYELTYVSADLRITRCGDHMMVHRRLGSSDY